MFQSLFARRGLSFERLQSFLEVAESGSIAGAAGRDPVRQSQFSRQIGELEEFFGVRLTRRVGRGLELTADGKHLAGLLQTQFRELEAFRTRDTGMPFTVTVGAGDSLITWIIVPRLGRLLKRFPGMTTEVKNLRSAEIVDRLIHGRLDFGVARAGLVKGPLQSAPLGSLPYGLFVPVRMARKFSHLSPKEMLLRLPVAALGSDGEHFERIIRDGGRKGRPVNIRLITGSFPQAARAVDGGDFAAILPVHAATDLSPEVAKVFPLDFLRRATREIVLAWNPRILRATPRGESLRDELTKLLAIDAARRRAGSDR